jgi:hypothetical protein
MITDCLLLQKRETQRGIGRRQTKNERNRGEVGSSRHKQKIAEENQQTKRRTRSSKKMD